jgi:hypothetical protein
MKLLFLEFVKSNPAIDVTKSDLRGNGDCEASLLAENTDGRRDVVLESVNAASVLFKSSTSGFDAGSLLRSIRHVDPSGHLSRGDRRMKGQSCMSRGRSPFVGGAER